MSHHVVNKFSEEFSMGRRSVKKPVKPGEFHIRVDDDMGQEIRDRAKKEGRDYNVEIERLLRQALKVCA